MDVREEEGDYLVNVCVVYGGREREREKERVKVKSKVEQKEKPNDLFISSYLSPHSLLIATKSNKHFSSH